MRNTTVYTELDVCYENMNVLMISLHLISTSLLHQTEYTCSVGNIRNNTGEEKLNN